MNTFEWEDGTIVERPYVEINGVKHYVQDGTINGGTPASSANLNQMQNIINGNINDKFNNQSYIAWINDNPNVAFSNQNVILNRSMEGASHYEIEFFQSLNSKRVMTTGKIPNGYGTILNWANGYRATSVTVEGDRISFENAYGNGTLDNNAIIPYRVIFHYNNLW